MSIQAGASLQHRLEVIGHFERAAGGRLDFFHTDAISNLDELEAGAVRLDVEDTHLGDDARDAGLRRE